MHDLPLPLPEGRAAAMFGPKASKLAVVRKKKRRRQKGDPARPP
jgi:hypothetical protein